jgi:hypothetical protein
MFPLNENVWFGIGAPVTTVCFGWIASNIRLIVHLLSKPVRSDDA